MRSCKWVAEKVSFSSDRQRKRSLFVQLARQIPSLSSAIGVIACFETLCDLWQCKNLQKEYAMSRTPISLIKNVTGLQPNTGLNGGQVLHTMKMLSHVLICIPETWKNCPKTTNAVERKNYECKTDTPQSLRLAMINVYKLDKNTCYKHIAPKNGCSIS